MKQLSLLILFAFTVATPLVAQWKSENADYVEDLPFDKNGNLVFVKVVDMPGQSEEQLDANIGYNGIYRYEDLNIEFKPDETVLKQTFSMYSNRGGYARKDLDKTIYVDYMGDAPVICHIQIKDNKYRYVIEIPSMVIRKQTVSTSDYFKKDHFDSPGSGKEMKTRTGAKNAILHMVSWLEKDIKALVETKPTLQWRVADAKSVYLGKISKMEKINRIKATMQQLPTYNNLDEKDDGAGYYTYKWEGKPTDNNVYIVFLLTGGDSCQYIAAAYTDKVKFDWSNARLETKTVGNTSELIALRATLQQTIEQGLRGGTNKSTQSVLKKDDW